MHTFTVFTAHTDGGVDPSGRQPAGQELSVRRLAQQHLDTQLGGAGAPTSNLLVTSRPALRPELSRTHITVVLQSLMGDGLKDF